MTKYNGAEACNESAPHFSSSESASLSQHAPAERDRLKKICVAIAFSALMIVSHWLIGWDLLVGIAAFACFGAAWTAIGAVRAISRRLGDIPGTYRTMLDLFAVIAVEFCLFAFLILVWQGHIQGSLPVDIALLAVSCVCGVVSLRRLGSCA